MLEPFISSDHPGRRELAALRAELEDCWCADTSFWPELWTTAHPSVGQCAVTALVVSDRFGGEILRTVNQDVVRGKLGNIKNETKAIPIVTVPSMINSQRHARRPLRPSIFPLIPAAMRPEKAPLIKAPE